MFKTMLCKTFFTSCFTGSSDHRHMKGREQNVNLKSSFVFSTEMQSYMFTTNKTCIQQTNQRDSFKTNSEHMATHSATFFVEQKVKLKHPY